MAAPPPPAPVLCALSPNHTYLSVELEAFLAQTNRTHEDLESGPVWILYSPDECSEQCVQHMPDMTYEETCMYFIDLERDPNEPPVYVEGNYGWLLANVKNQGWIQFRCAPQHGTEPFLPILRQSDTVNPVFHSLLHLTQPS
jgi:hypothetical protein